MGVANAIDSSCLGHGRVLLHQIDDCSSIDSMTDACWKSAVAGVVLWQMPAFFGKDPIDSLSSGTLEEPIDSFGL